jgi:hypothetical protein
MKYTLLGVLASILLTVSVLSPQILVSLNQSILGKILLLAIILVFTKESLIFGLITALFIYHLSSEYHREGMSKKKENRLYAGIAQEISGSSLPSKTDLTELEDQMKQKSSKDIKVDSTQTINNGSMLEPTGFQNATKLTEGFTSLY